ncbi:hypothetical protein AKJ44_01105 [candidate division MSBL1 archaeon SCGC-AAA261F17]|uniref:Uncharacterized protein n=1 Tax=candidate division MSBL1 archaeon SCGC-AAA261F17 TaxID=1698274 RepID=A0A133V6X4_9EURY|nr:hypothetical protein AKJ44_01105 [candidate division MSBL1 archaeon SCGC-AAA261F17]
MLGNKTVEVMDRCLSGQPSMSELEEIASSRTIHKVIPQLEVLGIIERYTFKKGVGRPKTRCKLTRRGLKLKRMLDDIRYHAEYDRISRSGIPVTAGVYKSIADGYGAPLITDQRLAVPSRLTEKAQDMLEWSEVKLDGVPWSGFHERSVQVEDLRYLGLEDLIVLTNINEKDPARLQACITTIIKDFTEKIDYNLLLQIALEAGTVNEVGGLLHLTNRMSGETVIPLEILDEFQKHVKKRDVDRHLRYYLLVERGVPSSEAEHPVDREIRENWYAKLPTFMECREVFGWRGDGKIG